MIIRGGTSSNFQIRLSACSYTSCSFHFMKIHQHCKHLGLNSTLKISSSAFDWLVKKLFSHFWPHRQRRIGSCLKKTPLITNTHNHPQTKLTAQLLVYWNHTLRMYPFPKLVLWYPWDSAPWREQRDPAQQAPALPQTPSHPKITSHHY